MNDIYIGKEDIVDKLKENSCDFTSVIIIEAKNFVNISENKYMYVINKTLNINFITMYVSKKSPEGNKIKELLDSKKYDKLQSVLKYIFFENINVNDFEYILKRVRDEYYSSGIKAKERHLRDCLGIT